MAAANGNLTTPRRSTVRCAIYTRTSTEEGLEQEFNTLDAQRDAAEAFIRSLWWTPFFGQKSAPFLDGGAAFENKENECRKPERIIRRA